jgi:hypothetical protein
MNNAELPVGSIELETKASGDLRSPSAHFRDRVLKAIRQIDPSSYRLVRERIDDRSSSGFDEALCFYIGLTRVHINADFDRRVKGIQDFGGHASENVEMGSAWRRRFSAQDFTHSLALSSIGTLVDNRPHAAVAFGDFAWELGNQNPIEVVELRIVEVTLLDMSNTKPVTKTICRPCTKLAWIPPTRSCNLRTGRRGSSTCLSWLVASGLPSPTVNPVPDLSMDEPLEALIVELNTQFKGASIGSVPVTTSAGGIRKGWR